MCDIHNFIKKKWTRLLQCFFHSLLKNKSQTRAHVHINCHFYIIYIQNINVSIVITFIVLYFLGHHYSWTRHHQTCPFITHTPSLWTPHHRHAVLLLSSYVRTSRQQKQQVIPHSWIFLPVILGRPCNTLCFVFFCKLLHTLLKVLTYALTHLYHELMW